MSSIGYAQARRTRERVAKERRKKLLLVAGIGVLLVVLAIQVPRTLNMLKSDSSSTSPSGGVTSTPSKAPAGKASRRSLRFLRAKADDPFASRRITDGETRPGAVGASSGLHDPFQPNSAAPASPPHRVALPMPRRIIVGTPGRRAPRVGWTVVLASIPTSHSRGQAVRFARSARAHGVRGAARSQVVDSQPAPPGLLGRLQRHVQAIWPASSALRRTCTPAAIEPPTSGSSSGTRSAAP